MKLTSILLCGLLLAAASLPASEGIQFEHFEDGLKRWRIVPADTAKLEKEITRDNGQALRFFFEERGKARLPFEDNTDWTKYEAVAFWAYSAHPCGAVLGLGLDSENPAETGWVYFYLPIPIDWSGWKQFIIPKSEFKRSRNPDWATIKSIFFSTSDWPYSQLESGQSVVIDDIRLLTAEEVEALRP